MTLLATSKSLFPSFYDVFEREYPVWNTAKNEGSLPSVNVLENEDGYTIEVAAPGMKKENFSLHLENGKLTISSKLEEEKDPEGKYTRREFNYRSFERVFTVPEKLVDGEKISASYNEGILRVSLPKREEVKPKPAREIQVS